MSATEKAVWIWLPGCSEPMRCGLFSLQAGVGTFRYDEAYRNFPNAVALDPFNLPFIRSSRPAREVRQGGLFGVFRDASPEGFGLALLEQMHGAVLADPLARLELSEGDAVGAVEVCDDIEAKLAYRAPTSGQLWEAVSQLPPERPSSQAAREIKGLHGTSLGGERPKITVFHEGQLWIAKLQDRGDLPHMPLRECVAMRLAARCGIQAAETVLRRIGDREVLLVRRFDRHVDEQGRVQRRLYASAHTVLRLDAALRGDRQRSYVALAHELRRWCARDGVGTRDLQRELWRRMAFNAICGNGDDHPRNHGLVFGDAGWTLAAAFDITPYPHFSGTLAMAITRDGSAIASVDRLVESGDHFGYGRDEARAFIEGCRSTLEREWQEEQARCGYPDAPLPVPDAAWLNNRP